jgi:hypothetical protein
VDESIPALALRGDQPARDPHAQAHEWGEINTRVTSCHFELTDWPLTSDRAEKAFLKKSAFYINFLTFKTNS